MSSLHYLGESFLALFPLIFPILVANPIGPEADPFGVGTVRIVVVIGLIILIIFGYVRRRYKMMGMSLPWSKVVVFIAGTAIGGSVAMYGFREFLAGKGRRVGWLNGGVWMLIGLGINYIAIRELWQTEAWQKRVKGLKPFTRTGRLMYLLGLVLLALLIGIILLLSGRSDFSW